MPRFYRAYIKISFSKASIIKYQKEKPSTTLLIDGKILRFHDEKHLVNHGHYVSKTEPPSGVAYKKILFCDNINWYTLQNYVTNFKILQPSKQNCCRGNPFCACTKYYQAQQEFSLKKFCQKFDASLLLSLPILC